MATLENLPSTTDDILLDSLSAVDMLRFGRVSKSARHTLQSYLNRRYKLSLLLARFFSEAQTEELRTLMSSTGMLISGSMALQFFDRIIYPDSDLDLYLPLQYAWQIADWLVSAGYTYAPKKASLPTVDIALLDATENHDRGYTGNTPSTNRGYLNATCVLDFTATDPPRKVQLMCTLRSTIELILGFHSTCVMNLIAHDQAYCLYPRATLEERRTLTYLQPPFISEAKRKAYHKYIGRGWELVDSITRDEFDDPHSSFARGTRFIGDDKCWTLPILPLREDLPESNVRINSFALEYDEDLEPVFSFRHLDLEGFQQPYVLLEEDVQYLMEDLDFNRAWWKLRNRAAEKSVDDYLNEEEQQQEFADEEVGNSNEESATEDLENDGQVTLDQTLKLLMAEMRDLDINRM